MGKIDLTANQSWAFPPPLRRPAQAPFGPGAPVLPENGLDSPRTFEYRPGVNLVSTPRAGFGLAPFPTLRNLAAASKEIRLNIELIKRQVRGLEFEILGKEGRKVDNAVARRFFEAPDGQHDFDAFVNMLLEELLVTDAVTLWPVKRPGRPFRLELVDGTTIRPLLDYRGRIPAPPMPAYLQVLYGIPVAWFSQSRLIYRPLNAAVNTPYGTSPIEFILLTVNMALRRETYHISRFTEGNVPEALVGAPSSWTQEQVTTWQEYWDAMVAGNISAQRRMHFVPLESGRGSVPVYEFRKDDLTNTQRDKWLMQVACWAFGNSPSEFGIAPGEGLGGKGYMEGGQAAQYRSMLGPVTQYLTRLFNWILSAMLEQPDLRFSWVGLNPPKDRMQDAQVDEIYIRNGVYSVEYVQERLGVPDKFRASPPVSSPAAWPVPASIFRIAARAELQKWREKAARRMRKESRADVRFVSEAISPEMAEEIRAALAASQTVEDVQAVFGEALAKLDGLEEGPSGSPFGRQHIHKAEEWHPEYEKIGARDALAAQEGRFSEALQNWYEKFLQRLSEYVQKDAAPSGRVTAWLNDAPWWEFQSERLAALLVRHLMDAARTGVESASRQIRMEIAWGTASPQALAWAENQAGLLTTAVTEGIRERIRAQIARSVQEGWTWTRLRDEIAAVGLPDWRAARIARTEIIRAHTQGALAGYRASGKVWGLRWLDGQAGACPKCRALHGRVVPLDGRFYEDASFGDGMPPRHPNCRCAVQPVVAGER